jgi:hypothetical protein
LLYSTYSKYNLGDDENSTFMANNVRFFAVVFLRGQVVVVKRLIMEARTKEGEFGPGICKLKEET